MGRTVIGSVATRNDAERAVEHLVQEHGIQRTDVSVHAADAANSAGTRAAGTDASRRGAIGGPELNEPVEVSVTCDEAQSNIVEATMREAGATRLNRHQRPHQRRRV